MPTAYKRYLVNGIRDAFGIKAAPIRLILKKPDNPYVKEGSRVKSFNTTAPRSTCVAGMLLLLTAAGACAKSATVPVCTLSSNEIDAAIERSETLIATYINAVEARMGAPEQYGFSLAVSACGETVWTKSIGFADLENRAPATTETKFRIGSVSKTLTATALGQLVETGRLNIDAEIQDYVPDFPRKEYPITVRQVAGHVAGIRHYNGDEFLSAAPYDSVSDSLAIFKDDPLLFRPGSTYQYSTYGWNLLSAVVEGASGVSFLDYMRDNVFSQAGMKNTVADLNTSVIPDRTRFYNFDEESGENRNAPYVDLSNKWAGGGFISTPTDLLLFAQGMFDGGLVNEDTLSILTTSQSTTEGVQTNYGVGWATNMTKRELDRAGGYFSGVQIERIASIVGNDPIIGHSGGSVGGLTLFITAPDSDGRVIVAAVSNNDTFFPAFALPVMAEFIAAVAPN